MSRGGSSGPKRRSVAPCQRARQLVCSASPFDKLGEGITSSSAQQRQPASGGDQHGEDLGEMVPLDMDGTPSGTEDVFGPAVSCATVPVAAMPHWCEATTRQPKVWICRWAPSKAARSSRHPLTTTNKQAVLLVGFLPPEFNAFKGVMDGMGADMVAVISASCAALKGSLHAALEGGCSVAYEPVRTRCICPQCPACGIAMCSLGSACTIIKSCLPEPSGRGGRWHNTHCACTH